MIGNSNSSSSSKIRRTEAKTKGMNLSSMQARALKQLIDLQLIAINCQLIDLQLK